MEAEIITVGDELLYGEIVNSNARYIGEKLKGIGIEVRWISVVGDRESDIEAALHKAYERAAAIIITGGLGPTHDDRTKIVVSRIHQSDLILNRKILKKIEERFRRCRRGITWPIHEQALVPKGAELLDNSMGTAPGFVFHKGDRICFVLPGVPMEMQCMMKTGVLPRLKKMPGRRAIRFRLLRTIGCPESELYRNIHDLIDHSDGVEIAFLPKSLGVDIRLTAAGGSVEDCQIKLYNCEELIRKRIGEYVYGVDKMTMEKIVAELLIEQKSTIAVAESCTGGLICHKITTVPGSSAYFNRGVVAYSNQAKIELLHVPEKTIKEHGAVSKQTALAMASGVKDVSNTDIGISITGIAGPGGGTETKPVGLVFIGFADKERVFCEEFYLGKDRSMNKERAAMIALNILRKALLGLK